MAEAPKSQARHVSFYAYNVDLESTGHLERKVARRHRTVHNGAAYTSAQLLPIQCRYDPEHNIPPTLRGAGLRPFAIIR